jgi:hypothetical protein
MGSLTIEQGMNDWFPLARAYKWDIEFSGYSTKFPASMASDTWMKITNGQVDYIPGGYAYPENAYRGDFSVTVHEVKQYDIRNYFEKWQKEISDDGMTVALLAKAAREVILFPLDLDNSVLKTVTLVVIPEGPVTYEFTSDKNSGLSTSISFKVVGE